MLTADRIFYLQAAAICAALSAAFAWVLTPLARRLAFRLGAVAVPRTRDVHQEPIPRMGGVAVYLAFLGALLLGILAVNFFFDKAVASRTLLAGAGLVTAGSLLSLLGAIDDVRELSPGKQLLLQFACAAVALPFGLRIEVISHPLTGEMMNLGWYSYPLTLLWLVGVTNAVNWVDGIDGLAAGVSAIAAATLALMAVQSRQPALAILAASLFGSLVGFLPYNFNPAKIFMGGGSLFVGFTLAAIATVGAFKAATTVAIAPLLVLGLPIFDTTFVILRRMKKGNPIYQADRSHIHHRLLDRGYTQRQAVLILYGVSLTLCMVAFGVFLMMGSPR